MSRREAALQKLVDHLQRFVEAADAARQGIEDESVIGELEPEMQVVARSIVQKLVITHGHVNEATQKLRWAIEQEDS